MPIYEYRRPDGTTFEVLQKMTDDVLTHDPETGVPVHRVFHPVAVHFKGKGFYNTDYGTRRRNREAERAGADSGAPASSDSSGDKKATSDSSTSTSTSKPSSSSEASKPASSGD